MRCPRRLPKGVRAAQLYSLQPIRRAGPGSPAECGSHVPCNNGEWQGR
jgi:hypothetical protein